MTEICSAEIPIPRTKTGKVYLVGAGPGHPDLLTIRAAELLKTAEVIVYDRLIQDEVLALAKPCLLYTSRCV